MWQGLATSTVKCYQSAQRSFLKFCNQLNITPLPAQEWTLIIYAAHLAQTLTVSTIKMHMVAIRHLLIIQGLDRPAVCDRGPTPSGKANILENATLNSQQSRHRSITIQRPFIRDWSGDDGSSSRSAQLNHQVIRMLGQLCFRTVYLVSKVRHDGHP